MSLGFQRVLTSGGKNSISEGMDVVVDLLSLAKEALIILPGGGLKPDHLPILKQTGYLKEIHASCKQLIAAENQFINPELSFSSSPVDFSKHLGINPELVVEFKSLL